MNTTLVLSIVNKGTSKYPRAIIRDQNGWVWTPSGWAEDEESAMLFYNSTDAGRKAGELMLASFGNRPSVRYRVPIYIDLYSPSPVSLEQIREWLLKTSQLYVDTPKHGNGPIGGSLGIVTIDWAELEKNR